MTDDVKPAKGKAFKFPKSMALCADQLYALRQERLAKGKEYEALETKEKALKEHIIQNLPKSSATGAAGSVARVTVIPKTVLQVKDWDKLWAYIKKTGDFDLLQKRIADKAVQDRLDAKKKVPGVEPFDTVTVSLNKI